MPRFILSLHHIKRRVGVREINVSHRDKKKRMRGQWPTDAHFGTYFTVIHSQLGIFLLSLKHLERILPRANIKSACHEPCLCTLSLSAASHTRSVLSGAEPTTTTALVSPMEQRTDRVDAERGSGPWCQLRGRRLAVVIAVQNMLLAVCLVITLHVYWKLMDQESVSCEVQISEMMMYTCLESALIVIVFNIWGWKKLWWYKKKKERRNVLP